MTTTDRLLKMAAEFERKAAALREAASVLNGHLTTTKRATVGAAITKAAALRRQAKGTTPPAEDGEPSDHALMRTFLADGPRATNEIIDYLKTQGLKYSDYMVRARLQKMRGVKRTGATFSSRWKLTRSSKNV